MVRGPILKLAYKPNEYKQIGMVSGGTGIAPMLQVVDEILADPADKTQVSLIFANVSEADILMKADIDKRVAAHPDKFKVYYVVDKVRHWPRGTAVPQRPPLVCAVALATWQGRAARLPLTCARRTRVVGSRRPRRGSGAVAPAT